ncbi:MAG: hypothetical protein LRY57_01210, partial [Alphaproteobacteria bacterium]|nr:hypothetical protein [Alphaproteobacteria bacterium]
DLGSQFVGGIFTSSDELLVGILVTTLLEEENAIIIAGSRKFFVVGNRFPVMLVSQFLFQFKLEEQRQIYEGRIKLLESQIGR